MESLANRTTLCAGEPASWFPADISTSNRFKLLLVHSTYRNFDQEIGDLQSCGIPTATEARLINVPHLFRFWHHNDDTRTNRPDRYSEWLQELELSVRQARAKLMAAFPTWEVQSSVSLSPSQAWMEQALGWEPNLIFFGLANQASARSRAFRSNLRKLVTELNFSVRVARRSSLIWSFRRPVVIALDGPASAAAIVAVLKRRQVARGSDVRLLFYTEALQTGAVRSTSACAEPDRESIAKQLLQTQSAIEALGYRVSLLPPIAKTAETILDETGRIDAECLFLGRGTQDLLRDLISRSLAATVAANAPCSVEIVCTDRRAQTTEAVQGTAA